MMAELSNSESIPGSSPLLTKDKTPNYDALFGEEKPAGSKYAKATVIGNVRNYERFTWIEWFFLILSLIAFLGTLGITIERFVYFYEHYNTTENSTEDDVYLASSDLKDCEEWTCTSDFTFTILLIVNICYCLFYAIDGVLRERGFEILAVPVAISIVVVYIIGNFIYKGYEYQPIRAVRMVLAIVFGVPLFILAIIIYIRNGTLQFNAVGSNRILMRVYRLRSFITTLLTFNLHIVVNFGILAVARNLTFLSDPEKIIIFVFIVYVFLITPVGWFGINYELVWLTLIFGILFSPTVVYYVYKIIDVGLNFKGHYSEPQENDGQPEKHIFIGSVLLFVCCLGILAYCLTLVFMVFAIRDYNKGLNDKIDPPFKQLYIKLVDKEKRKSEITDATFTAST